MKTRAERRYKKECIKKRVKQYFLCYDKDNDKLIGQLATTPKPCSCYMCGNPRKHFNEEKASTLRRFQKVNPEDQSCVF